MSTPVTTAQPTTTPAAPAPPPGRIGRVMARYKHDHQNPINNFLHVGVGWPMIAVAIFVVWWSWKIALALFLGAYAIMFMGHFVFEGNAPTILKNPLVVPALFWTIVKGLCLKLIGRRPTVAGTTSVTTNPQRG